VSIKNVLLTGAGFLLLGVGAVGAVLPVLPTTPFVLAASACFAGNPAIRSRMLKIGFFREHLTNYQRRTGLKKSTVIKSLSFLWITLCVSMLVIKALWCTLLLSGIGIAVTAHILSVARPKKTKRPIDGQPG
jgi:hypothetical protein